MKRRNFLRYSVSGLMGLALDAHFGTMQAAQKTHKYNIVILGDTHFDTEPDTIYHANYNEKTEWLNRVQRAEFARNGEMWRERCPRMLRRAARLINKNTIMVFQMGDLIQGDCGNGDVHKKMLSDVLNRFKNELGGLPFVTVAGNHDIRGVDAEQVYHDFIPKQMSMELGKSIHKTTFSFTIGDDAYLVIDFNKPDDNEIDRMLNETKDARHTFVISHGPLFPFDHKSCRWFFHGSESREDTEARLHFRRRFAQRNTICLCGHTHKIEFADWFGDGGRITQMTMNSVWSDEKLSSYEILAEGPEQYGKLRKINYKTESGDTIKDETSLFDEYRDGMHRYQTGKGAGCYQMKVSDRHIVMDFYAGDSKNITQQFMLR